MEGYNRGYQHYPSPSTAYGGGGGGGPGNASGAGGSGGSGGRGPPHSGNPPPAQAFYGHQNSGFTYNFNYVAPAHHQQQPPLPPQQAAASQQYSAPRLPSISGSHGHSHMMPQQSYPASSPAAGGYINPSMLHAPQHQSQHQHQQQHQRHQQQPSPSQYGTGSTGNRHHSSSTSTPSSSSHGARSSSARNDNTTPSRSAAYSNQVPSSSSTSSSRYHSSHPVQSSHQSGSNYRQSHQSNPSTVSGSSSYHTPNRNSSRIQAPANIDEALQYTPLNSILPFHDHIIPSPTIDASSFGAKAESIGKKLLKDFNQLDPMSKRFRSATSQVSNYINTVNDSKRIKLDFKKSKASSSTNTGKQVLDDLLRGSKLGIFQGALLNKLSLQNQTESNAQSFTQEDLKDPIEQASILPAPNVKTPSKPTQVSSVTSAHQKPSVAPQNNFYIAIPPVSSLQKLQTTSNGYDLTTPKAQNSYEPMNTDEETKYIPSDHQSSGQLAIVLPPPRSDFNPAEYSTHKTTDSQIHVSKAFKARKRRKIGDHDENEALIASVDTRAKAKSAVSTLKTMMTSIFEAEDNLQPDTSGNVASSASTVFIPMGFLGHSMETTGQCLSQQVQVQLGQALRAVNQYNRLHKIELDDLLRLLKTCDNTLKVAENLDVKIGDESAASDDLTMDWDRRIAFATNSLETCKTILRVMTGGRSEKQLYSEEILNSVHSVIKNMLEGSIVPLIGLRPDKEETFKTAIQKRKDLRTILKDVVSAFKLMTQLLASQEVTEEFLIKMIYTSVALVFIDNATNDKDSVFGVQRVEALRVASMNILAKIFSRYPDQGESIISEILSNLDKLPVGKASAKNYKLADGKSIQLITALMMMLVQSSGTYQERVVRSTDLDLDAPADDEMVNGHDEANQVETEPGTYTQNASTIVHKLSGVSERYYRTALETVNTTTAHIINRALVTSKSAEGNSRNLLDLMVEDFVLVLNNPEWPAAEMFLRILCSRMIQVVDNTKASVPAKSAALELLGKLGSCIYELSVHLKETHREHNISGTIDGILSKCTDSYLTLYTNTKGRSQSEIKDEKDAALRKLLLWKGPFRMILEHLWETDQKPDEDNLHTAWGFFASVWASRLCQGFKDAIEIDASEASEIAHVADNLQKMIVEKAWYDEEDELSTFRRESLTSMQLRQYYLLIVLQGDFCNYSAHILDRLLSSIDSDQTSIRSKGLKALMQIIDKDVSILDETSLINVLLARCKDSSPQVRDSALDMIGKCLNLKPGLESRVLPSIYGRVHDASVALRKRAIKLLRDIYLSTKDPEHKPEITRHLLSRVNDPESSVAEQARKTFEELWVNHAYPLLKDGDDGELSLKGRLIIKERVGVITKFVTANDKLDHLLSSLVEFLLEPDNKQVEQNTKVCKLMVQALFADLLELSDDDDKGKKQSIMRTLVVFARASASLFQVGQLDLLKPYIKDLSSADDMAVYRSAIVIFRCVLPNLSSAHSKFLEDVATALLSNVSKLPMTELQEAIFCLSAINKSFDISQRLVAVFCSCVKNLSPYFKADTKTLPSQIHRKIARLICIVGLVGKYCSLDQYSRDIWARLAVAKISAKSSTVSEFIVDTMLIFANENAEPSVRKSAIEAIGDVAKSHPEQYMRSVVTQVFEDVFKNGDREFILLVIKSFMEFLTQEEKSSEEALKRGKGPAASKESIAVADYDPGRLTGASTATSRDGVSTALAQTFLHYVVKIALSSIDDYGYAAVELVGSVLRQGLVHPKECTPALVALGTCPELRIQNIASRELKGLAQKHESIVERAYMEGFRLAFKYQLDVIESEDGADSSNFNPKLWNLYNLTTNNRKVKRKFLGNLVAALEFEPNKLQVSAIPSHLTFCRFLLQNLAYFDYVSVEDIQQVASGLEKTVGNIGTTVVHQIETDIHHVTLENEEPKPVDPLVRKRLCTSSVILTMCWITRTYLRKLYSLTTENLQKKAKNAKDLTKAPTKLQGMDGRSLWDDMAELIDTLNTEEGMDQQFREFVELLTVDNEFKRMNENEDDDLYGGLGAPDDDSDGGAGVDGTPHRGRGRPKKRKTGMSPPPVKNKKRKKKAGDSPGEDDGDGDED